MIGNGEMQEHKELNYLTTFKVNNCSGGLAMVKCKSIKN